MHKPYKEHISDAIIRKALTREAIADQKIKFLASIKEGATRRLVLIQKMKELDQRLENLQNEVSIFKKAWNLI